MAQPRTLTTRELNRALLARQGLLARKRISVARMIEQVGGLQTQEPRDAYISLWSRIAGFDAVKLERAAERREVVRGSWMRCTIHTVSARDFRKFRTTLDPVIARDASNWRAQYATFDTARVQRAVRELLADDAPRSGREIATALLPQFPQADVDGLSNCARMRVPVVMTPADANWGYKRPPGLALAGRWLGELDDAVASGELLVRGLAAIGPATTSDLRTWSGLAGVKDALEPLLPELIELRDESGRTLYDLPRAPRPRAGAPAPVRFLGEFDNVFLSHDDRSRIIDPGHAKAFQVSANGRRRYTFLVDGFVAGTWKPEVSSRQIAINLQPFERLTREQRAETETEAKALAALLGPGLSVRVV